MKHNIPVTLKTFRKQTRDKCRQSHLSTGTTPIIPNIHCYVYTPERQMCLHTDPLWAPGNKARRKNDSYWLQDFATRVVKQWGGSVQGVCPLLFTHSGSFCIWHCGAGLNNWSKYYQNPQMTKCNTLFLYIYNCKITIIHAELWRYSDAPAYKSYSRHILQT